MGIELDEEAVEQMASEKDKELTRAGAGMKVLTMPGMPWSQMENEPLNWYDRFSTYYLPLGIHERSMAEAYRIYSGNNRRQAPPDWYKTSREWDWEGRAEAYDQLKLEQRQDMLGDIEQEIEDEIKGALLSGLRAAVQRVESIEPGSPDLDVRTAMSAIPRFAKELQNLYGVGAKAGANRAIEDLLKALPMDMAQRVMIRIEQMQQEQLPHVIRAQDDDKIIDGEVKRIAEPTSKLPNRADDKKTSHI